MVEIFVNPSKRELREMYTIFKDAGFGSIGFICDNIDDKIYFFSREHVIHQDAFNKIKPSGPKLYRDSRYLTGEFMLSNGKVRTMNFSSFKSFADDRVISEILSSDWSYFDKWIPDIDGELHQFFVNWKRVNKNLMGES